MACIAPRPRTSPTPTPTPTVTLSPLPTPTPTVTPITTIKKPQIPKKPIGYVATGDGSLAAVAATHYLTRSAPTLISIPAIGVKSTFIKLGLDKTGALQVPTSGQVAGWYKGAPTLGELGPAIVVAHVDMAGKTGVFFRLK